MATEEAKKDNRLRLASMYIVGLTGAIWDFVGDSALALRPQMGERMLQMLEKEMGLEIAGETPQDVMMEITRLFSDEFGFCGETEMETNGNTIVMKIKDSRDKVYAQAVAKAGVEKYFLSPILNSGLVALQRMGIKAQGDVELWEAGNGVIITIKMLS